MNDVLLLRSLMRAQKEQWEKSRVKRPCNAYMQFIKDFMTKNVSGYASVTTAVSDGNDSISNIA